MANQIVAGEDYAAATGQLFEIGRQLRQKGGYPFSVSQLISHLQDAIEGRFAEPKILFEVTSDGRTADELITGIEQKGRKASDWAKDVMHKPQYVTSNGVTYRLVGIRGDEFEKDEDRTTSNIFKEAKRRRYITPPAEVAPLLREKFSQAELGYPYVAVFHEPIRGSRGLLLVLVLRRDDEGDYLNGWPADPARQWPRGFLFLFLAPQAS